MVAGRTKGSSVLGDERLLARRGALPTHAPIQRDDCKPVSEPSNRYIAPALAALSDNDLAGLRELADDAHGNAAGLVAAISHAADWEFHRRGGIDFEMLPLGEAIDEGDLDAALGHAVAFHASIADRFQDAPKVREVIVAIVGVLTWTQQRH